MTIGELIERLKQWGDDQQVLLDVGGDHRDIDDEESGWDVERCAFLIQAGERR